MYFTVKQISLLVVGTKIYLKFTPSPSIRQSAIITSNNDLNVFVKNSQRKRLYYNETIEVEVNYQPHKCSRTPAYGPAVEQQGAIECRVKNILFYIFPDIIIF